MYSTLLSVFLSKSHIWACRSNLQVSVCPLKIGKSGRAFVFSCSPSVGRRRAESGHEGGGKPSVSRSLSSSFSLHVDVLPITGCRGKGVYSTGMDRMFILDECTGACKRLICFLCPCRFRILPPLDEREGEGNQPAPSPSDKREVRKGIDYPATLQIGKLPVPVLRTLVIVKLPNVS